LVGRENFAVTLSARRGAVNRALALRFQPKSITNAPDIARESDMFLISPAYAQAAAGGASTSTLLQMAPLALIFVVFYFFLIRPQQKKAKDTKAMLEAIRRGDRVVTGGGIVGIVAKVVSNDELLVDIAENTRVRVVRGTIVNVLAKTTPADAKSAKGGKDDDDQDADNEPGEANSETKDSAKAG
jgi:preprotein translocase subunit YajC